MKIKHMKNFTAILLLLLAIIKSPAQDYKIIFAGTGAASTVATVKVENLTKGTNITMNGSDILSLKVSLTGMLTINQLMNRVVRIYPNPMTDYANVEFDISRQGIVKVEIYNILGKRISFLQDFADEGQYTCGISGLPSGIYSIKISSSKEVLTSNLISVNTGRGNPTLTKLNHISAQKTTNLLKSAQGEIEMQYDVGNRLKFTASSGQYSTVITDIPSQNKTITFKFTDCSDADENNYPTVQIGNQLWMAENLKTSKYSTAEPFLNIVGDTQWSQLASGAYCYYNNSWLNKATYGTLYNWFAVKTGNLCPSGWHTPTEAEWTTLISYLGGESVAGGKLKETGQSHWSSPNADATNESGFTALPCGYREYTGSFEYGDKGGFWWTTTNYSQYSSFIYVTLASGGTLSKLEADKGSGISVRCLKNDVSSYAVVPTLSTTEISGITFLSAATGGKVIRDGSAMVTERGVCWNITGNPTITDNKLANGNGIGSFISDISGLQGNTTYYVRAYAINSQGVSYGGEKSFKTKPNTGTVTDIDGNVYNTVTIIGKVWTVENLKTTKYRNGDPIPNNTDNAKWGGGLTTEGAYCWYDNDISNKTVYGALYNWNAVDDSRKLCPSGWHVASYSDFRNLPLSLGGDNITGGRLKESGTTHWKSPNTGATNDTGFTGLPGGERDALGIFSLMGSKGVWWSANSYSSTYSYILILTYDTSRIFYPNNNMKNGYSVRCIKD